MTMKVLTVRIPNSLYSNLCTEAGEAGTSISIYVRSLIEKEHDSELIHKLREELMTKIESIKNNSSSKSNSDELEMLWILRELAVDRNPQIMQKVRSKIQQEINN